MSVSRVNYFFGRLNLIAYYENKHTFLMNSMSKDIEISKREFDWGFFNISQIEVENVLFITGYIVKYLQYKGEEIVDKEQRKLLSIDVPNRAIASSLFFLHPSNPSNRDRWKFTDQKIKKLEAEKYRQTFISKRGLRINEDDEVYSDILMAGDGYGKAELTGEKDGKELTASTERIPMRTKGEKNGEPKDILNSIFINFQKIWNRMID